MPRAKPKAKQNHQKPSKIIEGKSSKKQSQSKRERFKKHTQMDKNQTEEIIQAAKSKTNNKTTNTKKRHTNPPNHPSCQKFKRKHQKTQNQNSSKLPSNFPSFQPFGHLPAAPPMAQARQASARPMALAQWATAGGGSKPWRA